MRSNSPAVLACALIIGAVLRMLRVGVRWDELTLAYAAYAEPLVRSVRDGHPTALVGDWIGLHPPLHGTIHAVMEVLWPAPILWLGFSALCSWGAVVVVGRMAGPIAALVLATAPVHVIDAAEVNNYPLASLMVALLLLSARGRWQWLALMAVLAGWTHILGGIAAAGVVAWRLFFGPSVKRGSLIAAATLGLMPIAGGALRLMGMRSTWSQPDLMLMDWAQMNLEAMGPVAWLMAPLVLIGLRREAAASWLAMATALGLAIALGAAAAHQRPYLGLFAPAAAVAIATAVKERVRLGWVVVLLCVVRGGMLGVADGARVSDITEDLARPRAIDSAIQDSRVGDTIWLVAPALQPDDDKTDFGPVMWRMSPFERMPIARPVDFEYKDYRYGQPRVWRGRVVHTSTELNHAAFDHVAAATLDTGHDVWVVLYDHSPATGLDTRILRTLRPYAFDHRVIGDDKGLGEDQLMHVSGLLTGGENGAL
jgi:hypothetical protein